MPEIAVVLYMWICPAPSCLRTVLSLSSIKMSSRARLAIVLVDAGCLKISDIE